MNESIKLDIVSGKQNGGQLCSTKHAGTSISKEGEDFYTVTLNMWPTMKYFLSRNQSNNNYTIFSKIVKGPNGYTFQNPVGSGRFLQNIKSHLVLYFEVPRLSLYMNLFPSA